MTRQPEALTPQYRHTPGRESRALPRPSPQRASPPSRGRALLEEHFVSVRKSLDRLGRNSGLPEHEADEFQSWALFKLVDKDYRILASWEEVSSFSTYLTVVLVNLLRDYRIHVWGKWRPSAAARRQGREAMLLERLRFRDRLPWGEAINQVRALPDSSLSREELGRIADSLPERSERRMVGEEELLRIAVNGSVEERIKECERAPLVARLHEKLLALMRALPAEDRLVLKLHFQDDFTIAAISLLLRIPQKQLYSRRDKCLKKLCRAFGEDGLGYEEVGELLDSPWMDLCPDREPVWE
jgi:RNA polymerase sigma factor (sigma-70 family)